MDMVEDRVGVLRGKRTDVYGGGGGRGLEG